MGSSPQGLPPLTLFTRLLTSHDRASRADRTNLARTIADMMDGQRPWFARECAAVDHPIVSSLSLRRQCQPLRRVEMACEHVYSEPDWLTGERVAAKLAVSRGGGMPRSVSTALTAARPSTLVVYSDETPPKSSAEMEAWAELANVQVQRLAKGQLAIHEEFPDAVAGAIRSFLSG